MKLDLNPETEQELLLQAQERGVPLSVYLHELIQQQASTRNPTAAIRGKEIQIPLLHLGVKSPLHRRDLYDDLLDAC